MIQKITRFCLNFSFTFFLKIIDEATGNPIKFDSKDVDNYALYTEVGDDGYAILMKNDDETHPFRLIATLRKNHNNTEIVFDIAPIKQKNKSIKKRHFSVFKNKHIIFKRDAEDDLKLIREAQPKFEIVDFQETKGYRFEKSLYKLKNKSLYLIILF